MAAILDFQAAGRVHFISIPMKINVPNLVLVSQFARFFDKIDVICPTMWKALCNVHINAVDVNCNFLTRSLVVISLLQMYTTELNVDAALHELFAYTRQYQYEVRRCSLLRFVLLFHSEINVSASHQTHLSWIASSSLTFSDLLLLIVTI